MSRFLQHIWLAPRNTLILLVMGYRKVISPLYGDVCRYYPTCSAYGLGQLQQRGVVFGSMLTLWRILRCNPWSQGGIDKVTAGSGIFLVTEKGFVVPQPKKG
jgi:putative membrane protein insertion efficiency factor